jgi:hypothetical protein
LSSKVSIIDIIETYYKQKKGQTKLYFKVESSLAMQESTENNSNPEAAVPEEGFMDQYYASKEPETLEDKTLYFEFEIK